MTHSKLLRARRRLLSLLLWQNLCARAQRCTSAAWPGYAALAAREKGEFVSGRDSGHDAGAAVVLATDARLATDTGEELVEMFMEPRIILSRIGRERFRRHLF